MVTEFVGPNADTTSAPVGVEGERPEVYEFVSRQISQLLGGIEFERMGQVLQQLRMHQIKDQFANLLGKMPEEVAHELARRYADVPDRFRACRGNLSTGRILAHQIQDVLTDLANRKDG